MEKLSKIKTMKNEGKNRLTHTSLSSPKSHNFSRFTKNSSMMKSFGANSSRDNTGMRNIIKEAERDNSSSDIDDQLMMDGDEG